MANRANRNGGVAVASPTVVDRVVGYFDPVAGAKRAYARSVLRMSMDADRGYYGGRTKRRGMLNFKPNAGSADADTLPDLVDLRAASRHLERNIPIAAGALATTATNVVGVGLRLQPSIDGRFLGLTDEAVFEWQEGAAREFALFSKAADFAGRLHFDDIQLLALLGRLQSGDIFINRRYRTRPGEVYGTKLQVLEADLCSNPERQADSDRIAGGVEMDRDGRPVAYHISNRHPDDYHRQYAKGITWRRVPARYNDGRAICLHLYEQRRPGQTRGVPYLATVIESFKQFGDYQHAEVRAAILSAFFVAFIKTENVDTAPGAGPLGIPSTDSDNRGGGNVERQLDLDTGGIAHLEKDESVEIPDIGRPNPNFGDFSEVFLRNVAPALDLPYEMLIQHFQSSYSASRAALEIAWGNFRRRRVWLARYLCGPVYEMFMDEAVFSGRIVAPGYFADPAIRQAWLAAEWVGPTRMSIDPLKEAKADETDLNNLTKTVEQITAERTGGHWLRKIEQRGREHDARDRAGIAPAVPAINRSGSDPNDDEDEDDEDATNKDDET